MIELIGIGIAGAAGVFGHVKSKNFVRRKLRYTRFVEKRGIGLAAGFATALAAAPAIALLPLVGAGAAAGTALIVGVGVGTGVELGAKKAREA